GRASGEMSSVAALVAILIISLGSPPSIGTIQGDSTPLRTDWKMTCRLSGVTIGNCASPVTSRVGGAPPVALTFQMPSSARAIPLWNRIVLPSGVAPGQNPGAMPSTGGRGPGGPPGTWAAAL